MAGILDFLSGLGQGVGEGFEKQQDQRRKIQQIYAEAKAKQAATASDPMTQVYQAIMLKQMRDSGMLSPNQLTGQPGTNPLAQAGIGPSQPSEPTPPSSLNEYVTQRASQRQTTTPKMAPGFTVGKGGFSMSMKSTPPKSLPETQLTAITNLHNSTRGLEFLLQEAEKYRDQLGPLNPTLKRNSVSNVIRQYAGQQGLDAFLRLYQDSELAYRQSREGLRFIQGGQSIAQAAYPDPRNQTFENFVDTAKKYLARAAVSHSDVLDTLSGSGFDVSGLQPITSPYLEGVDPSKFVAGLKSKQAGRSFSSEQEAQAAGLPSGTIVTINGRRARIN